jgi:branched-chain amino acid transport system ATP-binding protein
VNVSDIVLQVRKLGVSFGGVRAVKDVSFDVARGEVFTLIGPNGAGKTTVFNLISRIYDATDGDILFEGELISHVPPHRIAALGIARTFQNVELFENASVLQNLLIGHHVHRGSSFWSNLFFTSRAMRAELAARRDVEDVIDLLDLHHYRDARVAGLPFGVRKCVELARALCMKPKLLMLDEPSSGLNVEETDDVSWWIQDIREELGITVLMVEHDMRLVSRVSDRVLALNQGEILAIGSPQAVQRDPLVIDAYLGGVEEFAHLRSGA